MMMFSSIRFDDWAELRIARVLIDHFNDVNPESPIACHVTSWARDAAGDILEGRPVFADLTASSPARIQHFLEELTAGNRTRYAVDRAFPKAETPHPENAKPAPPAVAGLKLLYGRIQPPRDL